MYWAMSKGCAQYISMGWNPSVLDLVTIFVHKFGNFESTYFTLTLFYMIGICKHEKIALAGNTSFGVIIAEINWSCKGVASTSPKFLALTSSNFDSVLWFTFHSIFQQNNMTNMKMWFIECSCVHPTISM
jgi:hypothetical protein